MPKNKKLELDLSGDDPLDQDLSEWLATAQWKPMRFVLAPKDTTVTLRLPAELVATTKSAAKSQGLKYQQLMRQFIIEGLGRGLAKRPKAARSH